MKKIYILIVAALAVLACSRSAEQETAPVRIPVRFSATVGQFTTKLSDSFFEEGDCIGISALSPINASNVKYVFSGGVFVPENPDEAICWAPGQRTGSIFYAYYPYREDFSMTVDGGFGEDSDSPWNFLVFVESDQSTPEGYAASNQLRTSITGDCKPGKEVPLSFIRSVAKVNIHIDNRLKDPVREVYMTDVYGRYYVLGENRTDGNKGTIKARDLGNDNWGLFLTPQSSSPTIVVVTESGMSYPFTAASGFQVYRRQSVNIPILLSEDTQAGFIPQVEEWSDDSEYVFNNESWLSHKRLEEFTGDYEFTTDGQHSGGIPWVVNVFASGLRLGFNNLFNNEGWSGTDTSFYGTLSEDGQSIIIPLGQLAEYMYQNQYPIRLDSIDAEGEDLVADAIVVTIVRDATGVLSGLDFGEYGIYAHIPDMGYIGYSFPHITATKLRY